MKDYRCSWFEFTVCEYHASCVSHGIETIECYFHFLYIVVKRHPFSRVRKFTINKHAKMNQTMYETIINSIHVFMEKMVIPVNTDEQRRLARTKLFTFMIVEY